MDGLVSIIIPAYNAEKWIAQTICSAVEQTWPTKEIVVVDDGSSDKTLQIAKRFESKTVKVITQDNRGASAARNAGLSVSQGDYIQWLDADDVLDPDKITAQLHSGDCSKSSRLLLSSAFATFYFRRSKARFTPSPLWQDLLPVDWLLAKFNGNAWMSPAVWLVSRGLTETAGQWDERLSLDDDGEYFCRVVAASEGTRFVRAARSYYRQGNSGSISRRHNDKACDSLYLSLSLCLDHLLSLEDSERTRKACLNHLQTWFIYFYPEKEDKLAELAKRLGGNLSPPDLGKKYLLAEKLFGWSTAKNLLFSLPRYKESIYFNIDRIGSILR